MYSLWGLWCLPYASFMHLSLSKYFASDNLHLSLDLDRVCQYVGTVNNYLSECLWQYLSHNCSYSLSITVSLYGLWSVSILCVEIPKVKQLTTADLGNFQSQSQIKVTQLIKRNKVTSSGSLLIRINYEIKLNILIYGSYSSCWGTEEEINRKYK